MREERWREGKEMNRGARGKVIDEGEGDREVRERKRGGERKRGVGRGNLLD